MFAFIITEPDYDNDELFPVQIDTRFGNDNKVLFNEQKELFIGTKIKLSKQLKNPKT